MRRVPQRRYGHASARKLSAAQVEALDKFSQPGGHGFGEFSYLSVATAKALYRLGYIAVGSREYMRWAVVTPAGLDALNAVSSALSRAPDHSSIVHPPYGFDRWARWSDAERVR